MDLLSSLHDPSAKVLATSQSGAQLLLQKHQGLRSLVQYLPYFNSAETTESWLQYENLFLCCLRTSDDKTAYMCLERLTQRFGALDPKIMSLKGLYQEAIATDESELKRILNEYESFLIEDPLNIPISKRRVALLQELHRTDEAVDVLVNILERSPTDIETLVELGEIYCANCTFDRAIYCFEEVLLVSPNAWNMHARLGEILYMASCMDTAGRSTILLSRSTERFCRSIELCSNYSRGYLGLKMACDKLLTLNDTYISEPGGGNIYCVDTLRNLSSKAQSYLTKVASHELTA